MPSDQPITQWLNSEQVDLLRPWFVDRNEPNYAWQHACSAVMALPALRAFWPMSSVDYTTTSRARDVAGGGYHLSDNNTVTFRSTQSDALPGLAPYAEFNGVNQYLSRADGGAANWADITGTEAYIVAAQRGLTLGGWFYLNTLATIAGFIGKYGPATQRAYLLYFASGTTDFRFNLSFDGTATFAASSSVTPLALNWFHIVARFTPSTESAIFVNGVKSTNVAGIPASVWDSTTGFNIGAYNNGTAGLQNGRASLCFLCAAALSDSIIGALYQSTRKLYGV